MRYVATVSYVDKLFSVRERKLTVDANNEESAATVARNMFDSFMGEKGTSFARIVRQDLV